MTPRTPRRSQFGEGIERAIVLLISKGFSAAQIEVELGKHFPDLNRPDLRTLQRRVSRERPPGEAWSFAGAGKELAPLNVLAEVIHRTEGRVKDITVDEARWIGRVAAARPELAPWPLYVVARAYLGRELSKEPTADLDALLAFAPWRSDDAAERYDEAENKGWIEPVGFLSVAFWDDHPNMAPDVISEASSTPFKRRAFVEGLRIFRERIGEIDGDGRSARH